ncbi:helix-turn-helix domain-containing protein, partial [Paenibacillus sp. MCAF20]
DFNWSTYTHDPTEEDLSAQNSLIVEKSKAYIDQFFNQKGLTLHEVAQKNHVSPNYLSYLFKKDTGYNLWEYVIKLRMEESRRLMLQTDLRRYEISERVGYESPEHFSKIFKKYFGMSPSEMKKQSSD